MLNTHIPTQIYSCRMLCIVVAILCSLLTSCDNPLEVEKNAKADDNIEAYINGKKWEYTNENGVFHVVTTPSYGYELNYGDTVEFWYKGNIFSTSNFVVFDTNIESVASENNLDSTILSFEPTRVVIGEDNLLQGLHNGLLLCRLGQKSSIFFNSSYGYGDQWVGIVKPWSSLVFNVDIIHLNSPAIEREKEEIAGMDLSGYTLHNTGLYYKFTNDTTGFFPQPKDTIYAWYKCSLPNGALIEESELPNSEISISNDLIPALYEGYQLLSPGRSANLVVPSPMGYGKNGSHNVNPYQPLLIEIRLDSIK